MLLLKLLLFLLYPYFDWGPTFVCCLKMLVFLFGEISTSSLLSLFKALCFIFRVESGEEKLPSLFYTLILSVKLNLFGTKGRSRSSGTLSSSSPSLTPLMLYSSIYSLTWVSSGSSSLSEPFPWSSWLNCSCFSSLGKAGLFGWLRLS